MGGVYSILPNLLGIESFNDMLVNIALIPITYPSEIGGILWYLYVIIGIYFIIPFISDYVISDMKYMRCYLILWFLSSIAGIVSSYLPQILGATPFCEYNMLMYFSGYLGYCMLGKYISDNSIKFNVFVAIVIYVTLAFSIPLLNDDANDSQLSSFLSPQAIGMSAIIFIIIKNIKYGKKFMSFIKSISSVSFGIYLSHMAIYSTITSRLYQISTSPIIQIIVIIFTFVVAFLFSHLFSFIRKKKRMFSDSLTIR